MKTTTKMLLSAVAAAAVVSSAHAMDEHDNGMDHACEAYKLSCDGDDVLMMTHHATEDCMDESSTPLHAVASMADFETCQPFDDEEFCTDPPCSLKFTCTEQVVTNYLYPSADCTGTSIMNLPLSAVNSQGDCISECEDESDSDDSDTDEIVTVVPSPPPSAGSRATAAVGAVLAAAVAVFAF